MHAFKVKLVLLSSILLWASVFVGIRIGLSGFSPGALALLRFIVASLCMMSIYHLKVVKSSIPWAVKIQLLLSGMAGIGVYNLCLNMGEVKVSAGIASFIIGMMPVLTVILSMVFLNERLNRGHCLGIGISLVGLILLTLGENSQNQMIQGVLLILVSSLMGAILTTIQKKLLKKYHPVAVTSWVMWGGTLFLVLFVPDLLNEIRTGDSFSFLTAIYLGVGPGAVAYLFWGYVLQNMPASKAALSLYSLPLVSTLLGFVCLNERPSLMSLTGGVIALGGAIVAHQYQKQPDSPTRDNKVVAV